MKDIFKPGDIKTFSKEVTKEDTATFDSGQVHPLYGTFALARDAEWVGRLFVLDLKDDDEEGIGNSIILEHLAPVKVGAKVDFTAKIKLIDDNKIICNFEAKVGNTLIARGETGQKVLKKDVVQKILDNALVG